ncbi:MAG: hypothetical protein IJM90_01600 [Firmicutes bacterium]|nr:hypothetical protein [Bacillota bacterium]
MANTVASGVATPAAVIHRGYLYYAFSVQEVSDGVPENILFVKQYDLNDSSDPGKAIFELHDKSRPLFYTWRFYGDYVVVRVGTTTTTWYVYDINRDTSSPLFEIPYKDMPDSFEIKDG